MNKRNIFVNDEEKTLVVSKAFNKKACIFGSDEYYLLRKAKAECPNYGIELLSSGKKTYNGLSFKRMAEYIQTQPNAAERMLVFEAVKRIAKAKGAMYPLTKKWFLKTYPQFKENEIGDDERKQAVEDEKVKAAEAKAKAKEEAEAKATAAAEEELASIIEPQSSDAELATAAGF